MKTAQGRGEITEQRVYSGVENLAATFSTISPRRYRGRFQQYNFLKYLKKDVVSTFPRD